jgi:hypothetical protein
MFLLIFAGFRTFLMEGANQKPSNLGISIFANSLQTETYRDGNLNRRATRTGHRWTQMSDCTSATAERNKGPSFGGKREEGISTLKVIAKGLDTTMSRACKIASRLHGRNGEGSGTL